MQVEWYGQSAFRLSADGTTVFIDPFGDISGLSSRGLEWGYPAIAGVDAHLLLVTHEHMDWHGSWENYMGAKARLFEILNTSYRKPSTPKAAVINADDKSYAWLRKIPADMQYVYGLGGRIAQNSGGHAVLAADRRPFAGDVRLHAPGGRGSRYSVPRGR